MGAMPGQGTIALTMELGTLVMTRLAWVLGQGSLAVTTGLGTQGHLRQGEQDAIKVF